MKASVMVATFPFGGTEHYSVRNYVAKLRERLRTDKRVSNVYAMDEDDTPITMSRNKVLKECLDKEIDFCLMIDSDMYPDVLLGIEEDAAAFWDSSFDFALKSPKPCVVAAPYCGPPPHENVYVFRWARYSNDNPNPDMRLEQYPREEAAIRVGFEQVAALPTGLCLIDCRIPAALEPAWFEYEYSDKYKTKKVTTEDVYFTRNAGIAGFPQYVNWDAWCGHHKRKLVTPPKILTADSVTGGFREALLRNVNSNERMIDVNAKGVPGRHVMASDGESPEPKKQRRAS
jgi:hypothetical protein